MKQMKFVMVGLATAAILAAVCLALLKTRHAGETRGNSGQVEPALANTAESDSPGLGKSASTDDGKTGEKELPGNSAEAGKDSGEGDAAKTNGREDKDEQRVEAFDAETDQWSDPEKRKSPTMEDISAFTDKFKSLPRSRKGECLQRALNLVPDENIMLLVGILMDKAVDNEFVELVYNDVLNRPEDVKKPILRQIFKDKTHPCWPDTAWILDITGEIPQKK